MRCVDDVLDQGQDGWVVRLVEVRDLLVHPVRRHGVLDQVVGPDREEVYFLSKLMSQDSRSWNLNHDPDLDAVSYCHAFSD